MSALNRPQTNGPWKSVSMILMGILLGCAGSAAVNSPSTAQAEARPPAWEHMCMGPSMSVSGVNDDVQKAGREGWELVAISQGTVCFKRPA